MSIGRRLLAKSIAPSPLGGLSEPLISKTDGEGSSDGDEENADGQSSSIGIIIGALLLGAAGIAASTMAMVSAAGMVAVYLAGGLCVVNSVSVVKNEYEISKVKGYRDGINLLRREANRLGNEVGHLVSAINDLQHEAELMKTFEVQLSEISRKQGIAVTEIVSLCKENEEILARQKANLKQIFLSDIAKAFISSDLLTAEMKLDMKNLPLLIMRLQIQLSSHGMQLDTQEFETLVRENNDVGHIIKSCGEMLNPSEGRGTSKVANLVTLDSEHSKGSLEVARGGKASLCTKPALEHRNTVVRDVKRGLSMKGIQVDSDISDIESDYDEDTQSDIIRRARKHRAPDQHGLSKRGDQEQTHVKGLSKFKAAARVSKLQSGATSHETLDRRNSNPKIAQNTEVERKGRLKSAAMMASAAMPKRTRSTSEAADSISLGSSKSDGRRRSRQSETTRNSFTGESFPPPPLRKTKSSERGSDALKKSATSAKSRASNPDLRSNRRPSSTPRMTRPKSMMGSSSSSKSDSRRRRKEREGSF